MGLQSYLKTSVILITFLAIGLGCIMWRVKEHVNGVASDRDKSILKIFIVVLYFVVPILFAYTLLNPWRDRLLIIVDVMTFSGITLPQLAFLIKPVTFEQRKEFRYILYFLLVMLAVSLFFTTYFLSHSS